MQNLIELEQTRRSVNWKNLSIVIIFHLLTIPASFVFMTCKTAG